MKLLAAAFLALTLGAGTLSAQDKSAFPFVDLARAQALIDVLTKENETLKAEAGRLRQEAAALSQQLAATQSGTVVITALWNDAHSSYAELVAIDAEVVDRGLKTKSAAAATQALALLKRLSKRLEELGTQGVGLGKDIDSRLSQAAVDEARWNRNTDDIIVLQATVARTKAQQTRLEAAIAGVSNLQAQVDAALK